MRERGRVISSVSLTSSVLLSPLRSSSATLPSPFLETPFLQAVREGRLPPSALDQPQDVSGVQGLPEPGTSRRRQPPRASPVAPSPQADDADDAATPTATPADAAAGRPAERVAEGPAPAPTSATSPKSTLGAADGTPVVVREPDSASGAAAPDVRLAEEVPLPRATPAGRRSLRGDLRRGIALLGR